MFFSSEDALSVVGNLVIIEQVDVRLKTDELALSSSHFLDAELVAGSEDYLLLLEALEVGL